MAKLSRQSIGYLYAVSAYLLWGTFPLIVAAASFADPFEVVVWRLVFGFLFAILLITVMRSFKELWEIIRNPKKLGWLGVAAFFIFINWTVYVVAIATGHVIESSLGYFINPLLTILVAVVFLKERLRKLQWAALAIALLAVIVLTVDYGRPPWIAFILAFSFATYSLAKNKIGGRVNAIHSFTIESGLLLPVAAVQFFIVASYTPIQFGTAGFWPSMILVGFGIMTAIPLILFGAAASRIPLAMIGFIQYLTPTAVFVLGITVFGEEMPPVRLVGFALVWTGLAVLTFDALKNRPQKEVSTEI
ncbi:MAG: EamA family transporter RarD [Actinomycetota bacterium]